MKMINIKRQELKRTINDFEKVFESFNDLGWRCLQFDYFSDDDEEQYSESLSLLLKSINKLREKY
jgi:hypothetical protein